MAQLKPVVWMSHTRKDLRGFRVSRRVPGDPSERNLRTALLYQKIATDELPGHGTRKGTIQGDHEATTQMKRKTTKVRPHARSGASQAGRSVFRDLMSAEEAAEMEIRATLLIGLERWLMESELKQVAAAEVLGVTQARVSDIRRGKINRFSLDLLVRLAARAGLRPTLSLAA